MVQLEARNLKQEKEEKKNLTAGIVWEGEKTSVLRVHLLQRRPVFGTLLSPRR
jgi:hypothetical protein